MKDDLRTEIADALLENEEAPVTAMLAIIARERAAARPVIEREATAAIVAYLRDDNGRCDCSARSAGECACGAWDDYKQLPLEVIADRIERGEHLPAKPLDT